VNKINEILTYSQLILIIYALSIFIKKWQFLKSFKWLIIIPIAGLFQYIFSVLIGPTIIGLQIDPQSRLSTFQEISSFNLMIVTLYGLVEYYAICRFLGEQAESKKLKQAIFYVTISTTIVSAIYLLTTPLENIASKKLLTVVLSFQLIIFSTFILSEIVFSKIDENLLRNPFFLITGSVFILFSSTCPIYYLSSYFVLHAIPASNILNLVTLVSYTFFYSVLIFTIKWIKI